MVEITTWYKQTKNPDVYTYSHFTLGHYVDNKPVGHTGKWTKSYCHLDTSVFPHRIID